ncbi:unnamed protein product [Peronospora destructor]|uniref:RNase NYN domain-containing protein n=1 Tax=Peronospora destructor TaxID=86335 RepID=A0AAV0URK6_9STRA|nr:unnamed protein product [Peronospora destructor]
METTSDWTLLSELVQKDYVVLTPSQSHDDFYVIDYAVKYDGFIVTNDMFRDHVSNKRSFHGKKLTSNWVRSHCIDFTFVGTEFMPNPRAMERVFTFQPSVIELTASAASLASTSTTALPNTILQKTLLNDENGQDSTDVDVDEMVVDHAGTKRSKNIDLSEVTYYKVPRQLLPMLHGQNGETMEKFQEYTGTYIVLPSHAVPKASLAGSMSDVLTLSIYGSEASRQQAVGYLDAFLLEMQQKQESGFHQWQHHMLYQAYQTVTYPQHVAAEGKMPPQDDQTMEIDPY